MGRLDTLIALFDSICEIFNNFDGYFTPILGLSHKSLGTEAEITLEGVRSCFSIYPQGISTFGGCALMIWGESSHCRHPIVPNIEFCVFRQLFIIVCIMC